MCLFKFLPSPSRTVYKEKTNHKTLKKTQTVFIVRLYIKTDL